MVNYFSAHKWLIIGNVCVLIIGIYLGFLVRPGFDRLAGIIMPEQKAYVAKVSDFDAAVLAYYNSSENQELCHAQALEHVSMIETKKLQAITETAQGKIESYMTKALYGITNETATATISLETKQGRRTDK